MFELFAELRHCVVLFLEDLAQIDSILANLVMAFSNCSLLVGLASGQSSILFSQVL